MLLRRLEIRSKLCFVLSVPLLLMCYFLYNRRESVVKLPDTFQLGLFHGIQPQDGIFHTFILSQEVQKNLLI